MISPGSSLELELSAILREQPALHGLLRAGRGERRILRWVGPEDRARGLGITAMDIPGRTGTLWAGPTPGRRDWSLLQPQLEGLRARGIDHLVCLLALEDLERLDRQAPFRAGLREHFGERLLHVPMGPDGLPSSLEAFVRALERVDSALFSGEDVLVHCGAGCGRTGTFHCCMLIRAGYDTAEAIATYRARRACGPESAAQVALIEWVRRRA
jgi:hypothetical protein